MIGRATKSNPTVWEFVERLNPPASDSPLARAYYCTLRRRGGDRGRGVRRARDRRLRDEDRSSIDNRANVDEGTAKSVGRFRLGPPHTESERVRVGGATP